MPVGNVQRAGAIDRSRCGCDQIDVSAKTELKENNFGRQDWQIKVSNDEPRTVYVTLAVSECVDGTRDYDTRDRDIEIGAGCSHTFSAPAFGNGYDEGSPFRLTVRDKCGDTLDVVNSELHDC